MADGTGPMHFRVVACVRESQLVAQDSLKFVIFLLQPFQGRLYRLEASHLVQDNLCLNKDLVLQLLLIK